MPSKRVDANNLFDESGNLITSATPLMRKEAKVARENQDRKKAKSDAKKKTKAGKKSRSSLKSKTKPAKKTCREIGCRRKVRSNGAKYCIIHHTRPEYYSDPF